jgi:hypothetical protein
VEAASASEKGRAAMSSFMGGKSGRMLHGKRVQEPLVCPKSVARAPQTKDGNPFEDGFRSAADGLK